MSKPITYKVELRGNVGPKLLAPLLDTFRVEPSEPGVTRLAGCIHDASHLHGVVAHLASMNVEIVSIIQAAEIQSSEMTL